MDAFDDLCEKGWAISERKNTQSDDSATATVGDNVEVEYAAYIWDGLSTQISKYESTEDMSPESSTITICVGQGVRGVCQSMASPREEKRVSHRSCFTALCICQKLRIF